MALARIRLTERHVLMVIMVASLIAYGVAVLVTSYRKHGDRFENTSQSRVRWMPPAIGAKAADYHYLIADLFDPSLMSLPSAHSYSKSMWQHVAVATQREIEPPREQAFLAPPASLELPLLLKPVPVADLAQSDAEKMPADPGPVDLEPVAPALAPDQSVLRIEGLLERRALVQSPDLPVVASATALRPTRVRIAVAPDGTVRYATLDRSSGNETADAKALEATRQMRFNSQTSADPLALEWGMARFLWATSPPP